MIEHLLGDEPAPPPPAPHHVDIDLIALTGYLTAKPARYVRTIKGLTGEEKLIAVELQGEGEFQRHRAVFLVDVVVWLGFGVWFAGHILLGWGP